MDWMIWVLKFIMFLRRSRFLNDSYTHKVGCGQPKISKLVGPFGTLVRLSEVSIKGSYVGASLTRSGYHKASATV